MLGMKYLLQPIRSNCFDFDALLNQQEQGSKIVIKVMAKLVMDMPIKVPKNNIRYESKEI